MKKAWGNRPGVRRPPAKRKPARAASTKAVYRRIRTVDPTLIEVSMIRPCADDDVPVIDAIINEAARAYRGVIPADCWHEPYMKRSELVDEITKGVRFWGWDEAGVLVGVMGLQNVCDVTLIRHAYVRPSHQSRGVGGRY
jgi:hypothetical protein